MNKFFLSIYLLVIAAMSFGQSESIQFTGRKNPAQANEIQVFAKNITTTPISGVLGASNITLCIAFPAIYSGGVTISTPIAGQNFDLIYAIREKIDGDSVYAWNGLGATAEINFAPGEEVHIASMTFHTGYPNMATVKLYNAENGGQSGFAYNYIAPNGFEHCSYKNPFYSNVPNDPLLVNANGDNDAFTQGNSHLSIANVLLPVTFTGFSVSKKDDNAILKWSVVNEDQHTLYYDIQSGTDGRIFTDVQRIHAAKNGQSANNYTSTDFNISRYTGSIIYYRIAQTDANGSKVYSAIKQLGFDNKLFTIGLFPNHVQSNTRLIIETAEAIKTTVYINDVMGKMIQQFNWQLVAGSNQKEMNVSHLPAGTYLISVRTEKGIETVKFVKW